ncbi:hypothetical protein [Duganella violaceipulchra]|uniref:Uncharacterized protein n=1 Tax=Duganella violaceipulchra TaxID=2849652 RepID=A0AA41H8E8_9BURK|nr:hypothetical protein [Duganella violaceicalia]MBV6322515.1 hypothetical protein [Duganella violaceicalia]MCP2010727.1 hypothetical protein [Duganella violaceicalia]
MACLMVAVAWTAQAQADVPAITPTPPGPAPQSLVLSTSEPPAWQVRRRKFNAVVQGFTRSDPAAPPALDKILSDYESAPFRYTPMETLEILGVAYLPLQDVEKTFLVIVAEQVMGWYDVLRYASESGRAEIVNNEGFFKLPLAVAGPKGSARAVKYLEEHPAEARQALARAFAAADRFRETQNYDRHWPAYYGLERMLCLQDHSQCKRLPELDRAKWDQAWIESKQRVAAYYQLDKPLAVTPTAAGPAPGR